ncbi:DsrE/DsrF/TusD sulfur relay family protein [Alcanivorax sp. 1008]|uniref:DsrE/DsrF/TusD sulfur relay family protein n=1 Tax=Alcanivorax sp. 1008 TaxID=2816853 RepID=UPI001D5FB8D6|nr:DsrE family protein [Alcanivorax sp. 1008]MCC1498014.1 DsrE family protein [Alcanivorax sp. 1008]
MHYSLLICAAPEHPAAQSALLTARAILAAGHSLKRLFFFRDGVLLALPSCVLHEAWQSLISTHNIDAVLCVSAAQQRGLTGGDTLQPWQISGLGQWAEALRDSDRVLSFG